jgi:hypothetical protein
MSTRSMLLKGVLAEVFQARSRASNSGVVGRVIVEDARLAVTLESFV